MRFYIQNLNGWHICYLKEYAPFAFTVHLVLGERDVLVVEVYAEFRGNLTQVLIGSPLKEANIHRTRLRTMYTGPYCRTLLGRRSKARHARHDS